MHKHISSWHSSHTNTEMPIAMYGHYGFALLLLPTAAADFLEYEKFGLMESIRPFIDAGKIKVFSINTINNNSWMNFEMDPKRKNNQASAVQFICLRRSNSVYKSQHQL